MALQKDVLPLHACPWIRRALGGGTPQSTRMADAPRAWIHRRSCLSDSLNTLLAHWLLTVTRQQVYGFVWHRVGLGGTYEGRRQVLQGLIQQGLYPSE